MTRDEFIALAVSESECIDDASAETSMLSSLWSMYEGTWRAVFIAARRDVTIIPYAVLMAIAVIPLAPIAMLQVKLEGR